MIAPLKQNELFVIQPKKMFLTPLWFPFRIDGDGLVLLLDRGYYFERDVRRSIV